MFTADAIRAIEHDDEALRTGSVTTIEGAAMPEQRNLPGPRIGRLTSSEGATVAALDYEGWGWL